MKQELLKPVIPERIRAEKTYFYLATVVVYLLLVEFINQQLTNDHVRFLLYPIQALVGATTGTSFSYLPELGYLRSDGLIHINKTCSGIVFLNVLIAIGFLTMFLNSENRFSSQKKWLFGLWAAFLAYLVCLVTNTSRIILALKLESFSLQHSWFPNNYAHELIGVLYFLLASVFYYLLLKKSLLLWNN